MSKHTATALLYLVTKGLATPGAWHDFLVRTGPQVLAFLNPHLKRNQELYANAAHVPGLDSMVASYFKHWQGQWHRLTRGYWGLGTAVYLLEHTPEVLLDALRGTGNAVFVVALGLDLVTPKSSAWALLQMAREEWALAVEHAAECTISVFRMAFQCGVDLVGPLLDLGCCLNPGHASVNLDTAIYNAVNNKSVPFTLIAEACHLADRFPQGLLRMALRYDSLDMLEYLHGKVGEHVTPRQEDVEGCSLPVLNYFGSHFVTAENAPSFIRALYRIGMAEHVNLEPKVWENRFTRGNIPLQPYLLAHRPLELCHTDTKRKEPEDGFVAP